MSESQSENPPIKEGEHKTPTKRTPSKRMSIIERAQRESEELIKNMGGSLDVEGGRRTRSSARGGTTPLTPSTPPPAKKARSSTTTPRRGRPKKNEIIEVNSDEKSEKDGTTTTTTTTATTITTPKKSDIHEKTDDKKEQIENCTENDVTADGKTEIIPAEEKPSEKSEIDAKPSSGEKLESINEEIEMKEQDEKQSNQSDTSSSVETAKIETEKKHESSSATNKPEVVVEPMEVDGTAKNVDEKLSADTKDKDCSLQQESTKNDVILVDDKLSDVHENSIDKSTESKIEGNNKVDESKTGNDVCEPKISSPTSTGGDVVAAQTCN